MSSSSLFKWRHMAQTRRGRAESRLAGGRRPFYFITQAEIEFGGDADIQFDGVLGRLSAVDAREIVGNHLVNGDNFFILIEVDNIERNFRVLHPEAAPVFKIPCEEHAVIQRHRLAIHQPARSVVVGIGEFQVEKSPAYGRLDDRQGNDSRVRRLRGGRTGRGGRGGFLIASERRQQNGKQEETRSQECGS